MRILLALALVGLAGAHASAQTPSHTCRPVTIGQAVLDRISSDFNLGFDNQDPNADVRGFQLHIDRRNDAIPDTSFVKWPDPWPVEGADPKNRVRIGPAEFRIAGSADFNITLSLHGLNAKNLEVDFSCHPDEFGTALKDGAIRAEMELESNSPEPEIQLEFRWHIVINILDVIKVDEWFVVDLVDIDIPDGQPLKVIAALVPQVSPDGKSVTLTPFVNVDDVTNEVTFAQFIDELVPIELLLVPALAHLICLPTGLGPACVGPVMPFVAVGVGIAVEELRRFGVDRLKTFIAGHVQCLLEPLNRTPGTPAATCDPMMPPAPGENQFITKMGDRLRGQIAKLELPKRIQQLPIPNYSSVSRYEPDFVRNLCP